jgi:hypothetical protein
MTASIWNPTTPIVVPIVGLLASDVEFIPTATISAVNVQAAIAETDTENRALSAAIRTDLASSSVEKGAGMIKRGAQVVGTIAELRDLLKTSASTDAHVTGYYAAGDGGGGLYRYDSTDTTSTDNGGTIIVAADGGRWKLVQIPPTTFRQWGASSGAANNYTSLLNALTDVSAYGQRLLLTQSSSTGLITGNGGASAPVISITKPLSIEGDGGVYAAINPSLSSGTVSTLVVTPSNGTDFTLMRIEGIALHNPATGLRTGRHGIFLDTRTVGHNLPKFTLRDTIIGQGSDSIAIGLYHLNDGGANVNGGMYTALVQNNVIKGGVRLDNTGDSNSFLHNTLSGNKIGFEVACITGASLFEAQGNNITNSGGAFRINSGNRFRIIGNNCENSSTDISGDNNGAMVNVTGSSGALYGGVISDNLFSAFGASNASNLIRLVNCTGTEIKNNTFLSGGTGSNPNTAITIFASCSDIRIGPNQFNAALTTKVSDGGVGTMGVVKTATLVNSWVAWAVATSTLSWIKSPGDGIVHLFGTIKSGTINTTATTLPVGFRPAENIRTHAFCYNGATMAICEVTVDTGGVVAFEGMAVGYNDRVSVNLSFPAANLAHAVSPE